MVLSGIIAEYEEIHQALNEFSIIRKKHNLSKELKWTKISNNKLDAYMEIVDKFFELNQRDILHFHSIIIDTYKLDHCKYNNGNSEIGFSKFIYQLLMKFGRLYSPKGNLYTYLDKRNTRQSLDELRNILNNGIAKRHKINSSPYKRLVFRCSKKTELLQINDIILGAISSRKNKHHLAANASPAKNSLSEKVLNMAGISDHIPDTPYGKKRFTTWNMTMK